MRAPDVILSDPAEQVAGDLAVTLGDGAETASRVQACSTQLRASPSASSGSAARCPAWRSASKMRRRRRARRRRGRSSGSVLGPSSTASAPGRATGRSVGQASRTRGRPALRPRPGRVSPRAPGTPSPGAGSGGAPRTIPPRRRPRPASAPRAAPRPPPGAPGSAARPRRRPGRYATSRSCPSPVGARQRGNALLPEHALDRLGKEPLAVLDGRIPGRARPERAFSPPRRDRAVCRPARRITPLSARRLPPPGGSRRTRATWSRRSDAAREVDALRRRSPSPPARGLAGAARSGRG